MLLAQGRVQLFGSSFLRNLPKLWVFFCLASLPVGTTICGIWLNWAHIPYIVRGQAGSVSVRFMGRAMERGLGHAVLRKCLMAYEYPKVSQNIWLKSLIHTHPYAGLECGLFGRMCMSM